LGTCGLSYSGGRDQRDLGSKQAPANGLRNPILKKKSQKRAGGMAQGVDPEFKPPYLKKINYWGSLHIFNMFDTYGKIANQKT
jgi:hypothetical protein